MSCNRCDIDHNTNDCPSEISFELENSILYGRCGSVPIRPVELEPLVKYAETETNLSLDVASRRLVYKGEKDTDSLYVPDIASVINIQDLGNVDYQVASNGDILSFDTEQSQWKSYTVPSGTIVTPVGIGSDGNLVKDGTGGAPDNPSSVPLGAGIEWYGEIAAIPVSYRLANGQALSRSVYSGLFALYGTRYGAGDGSTTFNLPNRNGRVAIGYNPNDTQFSTIGQTGGAKTAALSSANNGPHNHTGTTSTNGNHNHFNGNNVTVVGSSTLGLTNGPFERVSYGNQSTSTNGNHNHTFTTNNSGSGTPFSILDPYMAVPIIIRVI